MEQTTFIHLEPFQKTDDGEFLYLEFGGQQLRLTGSGCGGLFDGWRAEFLYSGFAPIFIVQLVHLSGESAVWYVAADGTRLAGKLDALDDYNRNLLRRAATAILGNFIRDLMEDATPVLEPIVKDFLRLDHHTKVTLLHLTGAFLLTTPEILVIQEDAAVISIVVRGSYRSACLSHRHVSAALNTNLQEALLKSTRMGHVTFEVPSPVSGRPIKAQASLCFDDYHFAYRFVETEIGLVFYIIAGYEVSQIYGMYIAQNNIMLCLDRHLELGKLFVEHLPLWLPEHLARHGLEFAEYLGRPIECITSALRAPPWTHIGHQLWNELTGIDRLLKQIESTARVEWAVPDGRRSVEFYGPIDNLFPRLRGLVRRGFSDAEDVIRYAYANSRFVVRITDDFVSESLRGRILQYAASVARVGDEPTRVLALDTLPRILLGLRVENRSLTDLKGFYTRLVDTLLLVYPGACFVIDGHNVSRPGDQEYQSHGQRVNDVPITLQAETKILHTLIDKFGKDRIVSAIGLTVPANILLIEQCDFFVSLWGAGLAKYRWICNKPGFVITNRWNLTQRSDLFIYHHPALIESPTELYWADPTFVTDQPEAPRIVTVNNHAQWSNFTIMEAPVIEAILRSISKHVDVVAECSISN